MSAFAGLALLQLMGAVLRAVTVREGLRASLRSPASLFFAVGLLYASALGPVGLVLGTALLVSARLAPRGVAEAEVRLPWLWVAALAVLVLARPWVPLHWDEFVWLGKARFEADGFGTGLRAALDPAQHLIPAGYPPLWPALVGWVSLGVDSLSVQVVASSLLVVWCLVTALEAWLPLVAKELKPAVGLAALAAAPLLWVHLRAVYVDLPVGLLGAACLGFLVSGRVAPACAVAVVCAGFKDEGLAHVLAATAGALSVRGVQRASATLVLPGLLAVVSVVTWRWLLHRNGVVVGDHALGAPDLRWLPTLAKLLALHATDLVTWGVFWGVVLGLSLERDPGGGRALAVGLLANLGFIAVALLAGPERVRVFAENGTLLNRLLVQLWPLGAVMVLVTSAPAPLPTPPAPPRVARAGRG